MAEELRTALLEYPEVSYVVTQLGRSDAGTDPWTPSHIEVPVGLKPYKEWPDQETKAEFISKLNQRFANMPGFAIGISQPIMMASTIQSAVPIVLWHCVFTVMI
ncbi:efflux RND transporter permease subunit [Legionella dresdenensis]|uniref:Efflux RND transporter permease subunit n=1 Tax=Legionella dresdenensis TaxID=450200 RepID=A0ABV8CD78_9GAMM